MRHFLVLAVLSAVTVEAQKSGCQKTTEVKALPDPLKQITPGKAVFPCDFGKPIPLGPVPKGCAQFEIIAGRVTFILTENMLISIARGTSEPGDLGIIVGDPLVARVKRDMPGVTVRGYPVQVSWHSCLVSNKLGINSTVPRWHEWLGNWRCRR
jgi:hypothetical protein